MKLRKLFTYTVIAAVAALSAAACQSKGADVQNAIQANLDKAPALEALDRSSFNQAALRMNLGLFWLPKGDTKALKPSQLVVLNHYPQSESLKITDEQGQWTPEFLALYAQLQVAAKDPSLGRKIDDPQERRRLSKVAEELDQAAVVVLRSDFSQSSPSERAFVSAMLKVGELIDQLYAKQSGLDKVLDKIPSDDLLSRSMARRNWGVEPMSPKMKNDRETRALLGVDHNVVDIYPEDIQNDHEALCKRIAEDPKASELMNPFVVVERNAKNELVAVPYHQHYQKEMRAISAALKEAAKTIEGIEEEKSLHRYLLAAADAFSSNQWNEADEAWAAMNTNNSRWYLRVAPDETYWEPCSLKAGFHMTFARINPEAKIWQDKLLPVQQEMEKRMAEIAGAPYVERTVTFQLPDFIDIISNFGDDRDAFGATIGQSLPNWGPVSNEGRGRTVAMSNLYTDPDSLKDRRTLSASLFAAENEELFKNTVQASLLNTVVHEAAHNLGPAHEYRVNGKTDDETFGGGLATLAEELKAQTAALWYIAFLTERGIIAPELAQEAYAEAIYWTMGHIARGMTSPTGRIQPYSQLSAIQLGYLIEDGAVRFEPELMAANGRDRGAFVVDISKVPATAERMMRDIASIKARGDKAALVKMQEKHIHGSHIPFEMITERMLRLPKTSFAYSIGL